MNSSPVVFSIGILFYLVICACALSIAYMVVKYLFRHRHTSLIGRVLCAGMAVFAIVIIGYLAVAAIPSKDLASNAVIEDDTLENKQDAYDDHIAKVIKEEIKEIAQIDDVEAWVDYNEKQGHNVIYVELKTNSDIGEEVLAACNQYLNGKTDTTVELLVTETIID